MAPERMKALAQTMIDAVKNYVGRETSPLQARLLKLETSTDTSDALIADTDARLVALESRVAALERQRGEPS